MSSLSRIGAFSLAVALAGTTIAAQGKQEPGREAGTKPKTGVSSLVEELERERARAPEKQAAKRDARSFKRLKVDGKKLEPRVERLIRDLRWHKTLEAAKLEAEQTGKPILWIHALGEVDGFL